MEACPLFMPARREKRLQVDGAVDIIKSRKFSNPPVRRGKQETMDWMQQDLQQVQAGLPEVGSRVRFLWKKNGTTIQKQGVIRILDWAGGGACWGKCASCDILVAEEEMLYKHIPLSEVELLEESQC